ncbi:NAD(P)H-hydrate dehydratase [Georgenia thermotolerans]|uniref:ADP-dependent (S)-NAD(P)H-hydrate dehydratase n=1 Tax=Georgenia thermotolerans TaxID=527326 RepID=A0A7J5UK41_9MICO|nr:NAD(P)H-hydrate dehydratase [Georgenia thermotolerans]KAE8762727.1 NAD(P)H-hydrate dehydratase [Georgenia thermotolerans]
MSATPITPALLREWPLPEPRGSKYGRGQVLVAGGARATPGAVLLAGEAALRVGAGRLTLAVARSVAGSLAVAVPEAGVRGLAEDDAGDVRGSDAAALAPDLERADAVLVGPGLGEPDGTGALVRGLVPRLPDGVPVVLDAFALGVLPGLDDARTALAGRLVLTPNLAEMARLLDVADVEEPDATEAAQEVARRYGAVVTSHGLVTDGSATWQVTTGHTGLGTSGSGDVLAGALTGLLARGADRTQAAVWATHLHASAGDSLTASVGKVGFLARELVPELPRLLHELTV